MFSVRQFTDPLHFPVDGNLTVASAVRANGFGNVLLQAQGPNRDLIINAPDWLGAVMAYLTSRRSKTTFLEHTMASICPAPEDEVCDENCGKIWK